MDLDKIDFEIIADAQKAIAGLTKTTAALQAQIAKMREMNQEGRRGQIAMEGLAGSTASFVRSALGIGSAIMALRTFVSLQERSLNLANEAVARNETQITSLKNLTQVGLTQADAIAMSRAIAKPIGVGGDVAFIAQGASFTQERARRIAEPTSLIEENVGAVLQGLQKITVNFVETQGKEREILNMALAGGVEASPSLAEFMGDTGRVAAAASKLGISIEDVFAATALGTQAQEPEMGTRAIRSAISSIAERPEFEHLQGKGLDEVIAGIREMFTDSAGKFDIREALRVVPEELAALGFQLMVMNPQKLAENRRRVAMERGMTGAPGDFLERAGISAMAEPKLQAHRAFNRAQLEQEIQTSFAGIMQQGKDAVMALARGELTRGRAAGEINPASEGLADFGLALINKLATSPETTGRWASMLLDRSAIVGDDDPRQSLMQKLTDTLSVFAEAGKQFLHGANQANANARKPVRVGEIE